jgi:hypothetical protein
MVGAMRVGPRLHKALLWELQRHATVTLSPSTIAVLLIVLLLFLCDL